MKKIFLLSYLICSLVAADFQKLYQKGDYKKAFDLAEEACVRGEDATDIGEACLLVGNMYHNGQGTIKDDIEAFVFFTQASNFENAKAQYALGKMYHKGEGTTQNYQKAFEFISKACLNNIPAACKDLGPLYTQGIGTEENPIKALELHSRACKAGYVKSCTNAQELKVQLRTEMLKHDQILEAYQAGLIDKDTADLYLQQKQIREANIAAQQQIAVAQQQAKAARDQASATSTAALQAQMNNDSNMFQQQLQNSTRLMQQQQFQNQQNINNNMRRYY